MVLKETIKYKASGIKEGMPTINIFSEINE